MTSEPTYPVSLVLDGPLFSDELETSIQQFRRDHDVESLRIVPAKSAAKGVNAVYFAPQHRKWALVRLASRYRNLFEIALLRGLSGEEQLMRQGFTSADIQFLRDIVPTPYEEYNPIVYDMLWLAATHNQYLALAISLDGRETFVPERVIQSTDDVTEDDMPFFTRFLRSHLIRARVEKPPNTHRRSNRETGGRTIDPTAEYEVTHEGKAALTGIVSEHERIFEREDFGPLRINTDLDPVKHLKQYDSEYRPGAIEHCESWNRDDTDIERETPVPPSDDSEPKSDVDSDATTAERIEPTGDLEVSNGGIDDQFIGEYTESEVKTACLAAAGFIASEQIAHTKEVKRVVWEAIDIGDRKRSDLWQTVEGVLLLMEQIQGRHEGRIWTATV